MYNSSICASAATYPFTLELFNYSTFDFIIIFTIDQLFRHITKKLFHLIIFTIDQFFCTITY